MKYIELSALVLLGLLSYGISFAQKTEGMKEIENPRRPFLVDDRIKDDIATLKSRRKDLSIDDRRNEIEKVRASEAEQLSALKNQLHEKKVRLRTLETEDKADMKEIYKAIDEIAKISASIMKIKAENVQKIRALLTDEQRLLFDLTSRSK